MKKIFSVIFIVCLIVIIIGVSYLFFVPANSAKGTIADNESKSMLYTYIEEKDYEKLKSYIQDNPALINQEYTTIIKHPVYFAIDRGDLKAIKLLVQNGFDINQDYRNTGVTPLVYAIQKEYIEIVKGLVEYGADINYIDSSGFSCISETLYNSDTNIFEYLVSQGCDLNVINSINGMTFMHYLAKSGNVSVLKMKDINKLSLKDKDGYGNDMMMYAIESGSLEMVNELYNRGLMFTEVNKEGFYPVHFICDLNMLAYLIKEYMFDINFETDKGLSLLQIAILKELPVDYIKSIIDHGGNINKLDESGNNLLQLAIMKYPSEKLINLLCLEGIDPLKVNNDENSSIDLAIANSCSELIIGILEANQGE